MGHSIGCGHRTEEYPTLAPKTDVVVKPGMVFCVETPYSATGKAPVTGGFNVEDTCAVTETGIDRFTAAPDNLFWK